MSKPFTSNNLLHREIFRFCSLCHYINKIEKKSSKNSRNLPPYISRSKVLDGVI